MLHRSENEWVRNLLKLFKQQATIEIASSVEEYLRKALLDRKSPKLVQKF